MAAGSARLLLRLLQCCTKYWHIEVFEIEQSDKHERLIDQLKEDLRKTWSYFVDLTKKPDMPSMRIPKTTTRNSSEMGERDLGHCHTRLRGKQCSANWSKPYLGGTSCTAYRSVLRHREREKEHS